MTKPPLSSSLNPPVSSGIERRASTRYPCNLATNCRLAAFVAGDSWPARVRNISVGGINLVLSRAFDIGDHLALDLRSNTRNFARSLAVRVCYCIEHPSGDWIIGGSFPQPLQNEELRAFLS